MVISTLEIVILAATGSVAGVLGGLLGIGGSIVMIPAMLLLFGNRHGVESQHLYQAAAMIVNFFVASSAAYRHMKAGKMVWPVLKMMIPAAIIGSVAGVYISNLPAFSGHGTIWLSRIFGLFVLYVMLYNLWGVLRPAKTADMVMEPAGRIAGWKSALVGLPVGLGGGLLGIGGGVVAVPLQQIALRIPLQRSIADSSMTIVFVATFGAITKNWTLSQHVGPNGVPFAVTQSLLIAGILIPTAFAGAWVGARLTHSMPLGWLRIVFACLMLYAGCKLLMRVTPSQPVEPPQTAPALPITPDAAPIPAKTT